MNILKILCLLLCVKACPALADSTDYSYKISLNYNAASVNPSQLNAYRNGVNPANSPSGKFNMLTGLSGSFGLQALHGILSVQYNDFSQTLSGGINNGAVEENFNYRTVYLLLDYVLVERKNFIWSVGGGVGKTIAYEYHQKFNGQDLAWAGSAIPFKFGGALDYALDKQFHFILGLQYEFVSSELKAKGGGSDLGGSGVSEGTPLRSSDSKTVVADFSGPSARLGIAVLF